MIQVCGIEEMTRLLGSCMKNLMALDNVNMNEMIPYILIWPDSRCLGAPT